jgi:hypothetical protein
MPHKLIENLTALGWPQNDPRPKNARNTLNLRDKLDSTEDTAIVGGRLQLRFLDHSHNIKYR